MKKSCYLLSLFVFFSFEIAHAQKTRTLFYDDFLYGKVAQVSQLEYYPGAVGIELKDTTWYDEKGSTLENHRKTIRGTLFKEKYIIKSDASGKSMVIIGSEKNQNLSAKFDSKGNMIEYDSYFKSGALNFKGVYGYDSKNNLLKYEGFDQNNSPTLIRTYRYDKNDILIEQDNWKEDGNLDYSLTFQYVSFDKKGNWIKRTSQKKTGVGSTVNGLVTERQIVYY